MRLNDMDIMRALKAAYLWTRALKYASEHNYVASMEVLSKYSSLVLKPKAEFYVLRVFLLYSQEKYAECFTEAEMAYERIEASNKSAFDKEYLKAYVDEVTQRSGKEIGVSAGLSPSGPLDWSGVSGHLRRKFPFP